MTRRTASYTDRAKEAFKKVNGVPSEDSGPSGRGHSEDSEHSESKGRVDPQPWEDPIPLAQTPEVPSAPLHTLPDLLRPIADEGAWALNCPADFFLVPMLALAGGAIGNSRHLAVTRTHTQSACLFAGVIGQPGSAKTPALKILRRPFDEHQRKQLEVWEDLLKAWKKKEDEDAGPRPVLERCIVSNVTVETLAITLDENQRGVVKVEDELSGLVAGFGQYKGGKGNDRQVYLALWSGDTILIDRKSEKSREGAPIYVADAFVGIIGGLQPDVLHCLRGVPSRGMAPPDDGLSDRFLLAFPADLPALGEEWREISEEATTAWKMAIDKLLSLQMHSDCHKEGSVFTARISQRPHYVRLTTCGRAAWQAFTEAHAAERNAEDFPPHLIGPWSKLRGYGARLALIVHYLRWACGEVQAEDVDGESMNRAAELVAYFKAHLRKACAIMGADPKIALARRVVRWICTSRFQRFQKRDAHQALRGTFKTVEDLEPILVVLEKHNLIRVEATATKNTAGRKPSPLYQVHPRIFSVCAHNAHNPQNGPDDFNSEHSEHSESEDENGRVPGKWDAYEG